MTNIELNNYPILVSELISQYLLTDEYQTFSEFIESKIIGCRVTGLFYETITLLFENDEDAVFFKLQYF